MLILHIRRAFVWNTRGTEAPVLSWEAKSIYEYSASGPFRQTVPLVLKKKTPGLTATRWLAKPW